MTLLSIYDIKFLRNTLKLFLLWFYKRISFSSHIFALGHLNIAALFSNVIVPYTKFTCSCNSFVLYKFNSNMSNFFLIHHDKKSKYIFYGKKIKSKFFLPLFRVFLLHPTWRFLFMRFSFSSGETEIDTDSILFDKSFTSMSYCQKIKK